MGRFAPKIPKSSRTSYIWFAKPWVVGTVDYMRHTTTTQLGGARGAARRSSTAPRVLELTMAVLGVNDVELGRRLGVSRQAAHARRTGRTAMTAADILEVAEALDVDPALFLGRPSDAVRWLVDHQADRLDASEPPPGRQGERSLEQKGGRLCSVRQHDIWSCKLAGLALAA